MTYLVVAHIGQNGISNHGHACVEQLSALAKLDGPNADSLTRATKCPADQVEYW